jgi:hypothetical protein
MSKQVFNNKKWGIALKSVLISLVLSLVFTSVSLADGGGRYKVDPWSFGVMADTQWTVSEDPEGKNPEYVSAALARAFQEQFIKAGVKLVVQVGDLTDRAGDAGMAARAEAAQPLIDAGIGLFPLRGNHETYGGLYFRDPNNDLNIPAFKAAFPQTQGLANTFGAINFSSPAGASPKDTTRDRAILNGLSYSFDYGDPGNNARFVIVDVEGTAVANKTPAPHATYGAGAFYIFWTVYKHTAPLNGSTGAYVPDTTTEDPDDVVWGKVPYTIPAGEYFRISGGKPTTDFYGYNNGIVTSFNTTGAIYPIADSLYYVTSTVSKEFWPGDQQDWISERLDKETRGTEHAFVFSHRGLMGANHADGLFGADPAKTPEDQIAFYASLANNGVRYMLSGHDHLYNRALVASPALDADGALIPNEPGDYQVQQIIHMAGSTKFYAAATLDSFSDTKGRETQISQELFNVGYYIYTVDGPRVTATYYGDAINNFQDNADYPRGDDSDHGRLFLPTLNFVEKDSWGYSTNGKQFVIAQGDSYTVVQDSFGDTKARIIAGTNNSTTTDETPTYIDDNKTPDDPSDDITLSAPRALTKVVNTGWVANPDDHDTPYRKQFWNRYWRNPWKYFWGRWYNNVIKNDLKSDILSLWGMSELGEKGKTDTYVLSMTFDFNLMTLLGNGNIGIATYVDGKRKNAVDENFGGKKRFVLGKYNSKYGLGTYGIDPKTKTAWAVLNYNADFAVAGGINNFICKK